MFSLTQSSWYDRIQEDRAGILLKRLVLRRKSGYESPWSYASVLKRSACAWYMSGFFEKIWSNGEHVTCRSLGYLKNACFRNTYFNVAVVSDFSVFSRAVVRRLHDTLLTSLSLLFTSPVHQHSITISVACIDNLGRSLYLYRGP